ncbi:signal peptide-containing protein [Theileria equi strain WA]|uniref:Signal peptide-containing protein n=1 Tax=Theileria equi strain WA TaxID=1537102 RepID=L0AX89_THEEQ|nr:signal peptide-containing protein [Theileria equi strain WA]AFZ80180.1 signal peptide-containing protein [Theileria equi strain WA]|eukprot:XP_004829846.1 signal peptide-containing protein [Theileria equi strain WA]
MKCFDLTLAAYLCSLALANVSKYSVTGAPTKLEGPAPRLQFFTLDITTNADTLECRKENNENLSFDLFLLRENKVASKLVDKDLDIWKASNENEHCLDVNVHLDDNDETVLVAAIISSGGAYKMLYFSKDNGTWSTVPKSVFTKKLMAINDLSSINNTTLDLSGDLSLFDVEEDYADGITERRIHPSNEMNITRVTFGNIEILKESEGMECVETLHYSKDQNEDFVVLLAVDANDACHELFFKLENGQVESLEKKDILKPLGFLV